METKVKRREWVKTAAIVFLSVLLVLTFYQLRRSSGSRKRIADER